MDERSSLDRHALFLETSLEHVGVHLDLFPGLAKVGSSMVLWQSQPLILHARKCPASPSRADALPVSQGIAL